MTVSTEVDHNEYTGNGATTSFPYTFRIFQKSDLVVQVVDLDENIAVLALDTDYTVTGAGGYNGGNVILSKALANGYQISISRELPVTQETDLRNQGKFFAEVHEDAFDKLTMLIQRIGSMFRLALRKPSSIANWYDALNNYIRNLRDPRDPQDAATKNYVDRLSSTNLNKTMRLPENIPAFPGGIANRANKIPAFDSSGNPLFITPPSGSASDVLLQLKSSEDGKGDALIGVRQPITGSIPRTQHDVNAERISALDLNIHNDGITDNTTAIRSALISAAAVRKTIHFPEGTYLCSDFVAIPSYSRIYCAPGAIFKLTGRTSLGGFFITGIDNDLNPSPCEDVEVYNLCVDCGNVPGENGINGHTSKNIRYYNPRVINAKFHPVAMGGRAFQFEGGVAENISIHNPIIENCSIGISSQGLPGVDKNVRAIAYYDVVMSYVDIPFNIDSQVANPNKNSPLTMSTSVFGAQLYNCGRITGDYGTSETPALGGGIICGDRGYGLFISGLRLVNDTNYGGIGAIIRGQMFGVTLTSCDFFFPYAVAIIDHHPVGFGKPSAGAFPSTVNIDCNICGNLDLVVSAHDGGAIGRSLMRMRINITVATLSKLFDAGSGANAAAWIEIINSDSGYSTGMRTLKNLYDAGNSIGVIDHYEDIGTWTPTDGSGAGLTIKRTGVQRYYRQGSMVFVSMNIVYPTTTDTTDASISGLPMQATTLLTNSSGALVISQKSVAALDSVVVTPGTNTIKFFGPTGLGMKNADMSGASLKISGWYFA